MRAREFVLEASIIKRLKRQQAAGFRPTISGYWFRGYPCTKDCGGHVAGYFWAKNSGIENIQQCPRNVHNSFREGCLSWIYNVSGPTRLPRSAQ